jgi:TonB family protein
MSGRGWIASGLFCVAFAVSAQPEQTGLPEPSLQARRDGDKVLELIKRNASLPRRAKPAPGAKPVKQRAVKRADSTKEELVDQEPPLPVLPSPWPSPQGLAGHAEQELIVWHQVEPEFPGDVVQRLRKGVVRLRLEVKPDGTVRAAEVLSTSDAQLNRAAIRAVAQWQFRPMSRVQTGVVEVGFSLD